MSHGGYNTTTFSSSSSVCSSLLQFLLPVSGFWLPCLSYDNINLFICHCFTVLIFSCLYSANPFTRCKWIHHGSWLHGHGDVNYPTQGRNILRDGYTTRVKVLLLLPLYCFWDQTSETEGLQFEVRFDNPSLLRSASKKLHIQKRDAAF